MIAPIAALVLAFVLAACGPGTDRAAPEAQPTAGPREDGPRRWTTPATPPSRRR